MFGLGLATKIYVAIEAVDMRKGFEGLYGLVRDQLGADPLSGHLFLFPIAHARDSKPWCGMAADYGCARNGWRKAASVGPQPAKNSIV